MQLSYLIRFGGAAAIAAMGAIVAVSGLRAQEPAHPGELQGIVRDAGTGGPLAGAAVTLVGTGRTVLTHADGHFHLRAVGGPTFTLRVERLGYRSRDVTVDASRLGEILGVPLEPAALDIAGLVVTGTLSERGADESVHPVNVLAGEELQRRLQETLAATLAAEPGMALTSMGPATARPVIRGLSGDRVLVLEDGVRVGDVSNSGSDHATATDAATARRLEVVRGPAALMYGGNALGGVVNVIRDEIPNDAVHHLHGSATLQGRTVNRGMMGSATVMVPLAEKVPARLEITRRTAGDLATPLGSLGNTHLGSLSFGAGTALLDEWGSLGGAFRYYRNDYGIPGGFVGGHAQGVRVEMERSSTKVRAEARRPVGPFRSLEADVAHTWYRHTEIEPPDILGTFFKRQTASAEVLGRHGVAGEGVVGAVGARAAWERHDFAGSLSTPDTRLYTVGAFVLEEIALGPVTLEGGLRYDWARTDPVQKDPDSPIGDVRARTFQAASGSVGMLVRATDAVTVGGSFARAFRIPDVSELYSEGPHLAAYIFEVGNPDLGTEVGTGVDLFIRVGRERFQAEVTGFHNRLSGYIYPRETGDTSRVRLPIFQFSGEDARLTGLEGRAVWNVLDRLVMEGTASYVRGTLEETGEPLPLMPPFQGRLALQYETTSWFARAESSLAARQGRVDAFEQPTAGYAVVDLSAGLRHTVAGRLNALTVTLENVTDRVYRNHLSRVKAIMPEAGRGLSITYRVVF
jgi:iron complex outermembrane receptor protein